MSTTVNVFTLFNDILLICYLFLFLSFYFDSSLLCFDCFLMMYSMTTIFVNYCFLWNAYFAQKALLLLFAAQVVTSPTQFDGITIMN